VTSSLANWPLIGWAAATGYSVSSMRPPISCNCVARMGRRSATVVPEVCTATLRRRDIVSPRISSFVFGVEDRGACIHRVNTCCGQDRY
jgi:hypothetical protein